MYQPFLSRLISLAFFLSVCSPVLVAQVQIRGLVKDSLSGNPLSFVTIAYEGRGGSTFSDDDGRFSIASPKQTKDLVFTAVGYKMKRIKVVPGKTLELHVVLQSSDVQLEEVVITKQKDKYSRKNNPAVELMKQVIANKNYQRLENNNYYQYQRYQKITTSLNDITPEGLNKGLFKKMPFLTDRVEVCPIKEKLIIPVSISETLSQQVYRKNPETSKTIIQGMNTSGLQELFSTGGMLGPVLADVFADVNLYDNDIRLLQTRFVSPISDAAISFYQYFIIDTVQVKNDSCYHLFFRPNNPQDFGFIGHLYVLKDSTYAVKRCSMNLPIKTAVNFVKDLDIQQSFEQLPSGQWVLTEDDMLAELYLLKDLQGVHIRRTTSYSEYSFEEIQTRLFKLKGSVVQEVDAMMREESFWKQVRPAPLSINEASMGSLLEQLKELPGFKYIIIGLKALVENFVETGSEKSSSKFDIGPINTFVGYNSIESWRFRLGGQTTANLHPQLFMSGYYAYGIKDHVSKYKGTIEYSFLKKEYLNREFPKHYVQLSHMYDLLSTSDKFLKTEKDNIFVGFKASSTDLMSYIRETSLKYEQETHDGFSYVFTLKNKNDQPTGSLQYLRNDANNTFVHDMTVSEAQVYLRYAPGETFINTKQRRIPVNQDAPIFTLSHSIGLQHFLGGEYSYHFTEFSLFKRFWLSSWGKFDINFKASKQWSKVPFPLLITPETNLSYIIQKGTYNLVNNMEFLGDEYASMELVYNLNGKLFNRIPLLRSAKWREVIKFRAFTGKLSDKNNPLLADNLYHFPQINGEQVSFAIPKEPYMEASFGIHNIFKLFHVEYVHRLNYLNHPNINKYGIRMAAVMQF